MADASKRPTHKLLIAEDRGDLTVWHEAGAAWPASNGKGFDIKITPGLSVSGRVFLRLDEPKASADDAGN